MDTPERWEPISDKSPGAALLEIRSAYNRLAWFVLLLIVPAGVGMAITDTDLPAGVAGAAIVAITIGLAFAGAALWRTGRGRRRAEAVCLGLSRVCFFAYLIRLAAGAA